MSDFHRTLDAALAREVERTVASWGAALDDAVQRAAEKHLDACYDALVMVEDGEEEIDDPAYGPFCGCNTCVVREVLSAAWVYVSPAGRLAGPLTPSMKGM